MPKRIQRKRTKGWKMPEGVVYVGRPSKWGNPYDWSKYPSRRAGYSIDGGYYVKYFSEKSRRSWAVVDFENQYCRGDGPSLGYLSREEIRRDLAGKDLACWCALDQPCHADVLLRIANEVLSDHAETCEVTQ